MPSLSPHSHDVRSRVRMTPDGKLMFVRFTSAQRLEHWVLMFSFTTLAMTGLVQKFSSVGISVFLIGLLGGVETVRQIHHFLALVMIGQCAYHLAYVIYLVIVRKQKGQMWPNLQDVRDAIQMVGFNLGRARSRPSFGRYSFEEKMEYWAMIWGSAVMIATGFILWFPTRITEALPGVAVPIARAFHGWEAILAVLAILTWHMYHTVVKTFNKSIFTGVMTEEEMLHEHPLEYQTIVDELRAGMTTTLPMVVPLAPTVTQPASPIVVEAEGNGQRPKRTRQTRKTDKSSARPRSSRRKATAPPEVESNPDESRADIVVQEGAPDGIS